MVETVPGLQSPEHPILTTRPSARQESVRPAQPSAPHECCTRSLEVEWMSHRGQGIHLHLARAASAGQVPTWRDESAHHSHRAGHARKASYYHCFPVVARDCRSTGTMYEHKKECHVKMHGAMGREMNWLTSVIERLASFSSRLAWLFPFIGF